MFSRTKCSNMCTLGISEQVSHVYHFSHSLLDDGVENTMAEGMPPATDTDQVRADAILRRAAGVGGSRCRTL